MARKGDPNAPYRQQMRTAERGIIEYALEHGETIRGTAAILGVSPNFLSERMRKLGIPVPDVRPGPKPGTKRPRPPLRVVSDTSTADAPVETLDEDAPEDESEEDEKWYEDAEDDDDGDGDDGDDGVDGDFNDDDDDGDDEGQDDGEDASPQGN